MKMAVIAESNVSFQCEQLAQFTSIQFRNET